MTGLQARINAENHAFLALSEIEISSFLNLLSFSC